MKNIKETINNDAYLHSCNCPVCKKNISRDYEEKTFFCVQCGTKLHQRAFTEEEMRTAIEKGLFSDVKSYFDYLEKQMCYGTNNYLYFSTSEIAGIINACWKVFDLKDTDYFALPICMESFSILNDYITGFENGVFCAERSLCNKSTEPKIPVVSSYWGVYGAAYTPKKLPKCTKNI